MPGTYRSELPNAPSYSDTSPQASPELQLSVPGFPKAERRLEAFRTHGKPTSELSGNMMIVMRPPSGRGSSGLRNSARFSGDMGVPSGTVQSASVKHTRDIGDDDIGGHKDEGDGLSGEDGDSASSDDELTPRLREHIDQYLEGRLSLKNGSGTNHNSNALPRKLQTAKNVSTDRLSLTRC